MAWYDGDESHQSLRALYGGEPPPFVPDREEPYSRDFGDETNKRKVAQQILRDLDLDGRFRVNGNLDRRLAIIRLDPMSPTRVLYFPAEQRIEVAVQQLRTPNMLARLHMRQGFRTEYVADDGWAIMVDLVIAAMLFWVGSGLWLVGVEGHTQIRRLGDVVWRGALWPLPSDHMRRRR